VRNSCTKALAIFREGFCVRDVDSLRGLERGDSLRPEGPAPRRGNEAGHDP